MPGNLQYMTYEGSVTQPGCYETVTWILLNRPAFVGEHQVSKVVSPQEKVQYLEINVTVFVT